MNPLRGSVIALAGLVGAGVIAWPALDQAAADGYLKRDDQDSDLVLVADDPDDPDGDPDATNGLTRTRATRDTAGATNLTRDDTRHTRDTVGTRDTLNTRDTVNTRDTANTRGSTRDSTRDATTPSRDA